MAFINKIYGNKAQWQELREYLKNNYTTGLKEMYPCPSSASEDAPLANFSFETDRFLMKNCKIDFIVKRLKEQYGDIYK